MQNRPPKILPGLVAIQNFLGCSKGTAQDYLRAVYITHEIFMTQELEKIKKKRLLLRVKRKDYDQLRRDLAVLFDEAVKGLGVRGKTKAFNAKKSLRGAAGLIRNSPGAFTQEDCARIIMDLANCLL